MTLQLLVRPEAEKDIEEAATWYEQQKIGLGHEFLDEVLRAFDKISERATLYPEVHRGTRRALIGRFPFGVYYRSQKRFVVVVAVMHGSRSPGRMEAKNITARCSGGTLCSAEPRR